MDIIKNKKVVYFADMMLGGGVSTLEEEFEKCVSPKLEEAGLKFENVKCMESPPFGQMSYDILFFDWGGMSIGNDMLGSFCRQICREAPDRPSTYYVMTSLFTREAMEDAMHDLPKLPNVFLNVRKFASYYKQFELNH